MGLNYCFPLLLTLTINHLLSTLKKIYRSVHSSLRNSFVQKATLTLTIKSTISLLLFTINKNIT
jgi:hypothetical protein